jgi:hypothetical protein
MPVPQGVFIPVKTELNFFDVLLIFSESERFFCLNAIAEIQRSQATI